MIKLIFLYDSTTEKISYVEFLLRNLNKQHIINIDFFDLTRYTVIKQDKYDMLIYQPPIYKSEITLINNTDMFFKNFHNRKILVDIHTDGHIDGLCRFDNNLPRIKTSPSYYLFEKLNIIMSVPVLLQDFLKINVDDCKKVYKITYNIFSSDNIYENSDREKIREILKESKYKKIIHTKFITGGEIMFHQHIMNTLIMVCPPGKITLQNLKFYKNKINHTDVMPRGLSYRHLCALKYSTLLLADSSFKDLKLFNTVDLIEDQDYVTYTSDNLIKKIDYLLLHPTVINDVRNNGYKKFIDGYNICKNQEYLLNIINNYTNNYIITKISDLAVLNKIIYSNIIHLIRLNEKNITHDTISVILNNFFENITTENLLCTIKSFSKSIHKNYELIILNDVNNCKIDIDKLQKTGLPITYVQIKNKQWISSCINYNVGFYIAKSDNILFQNSLICHNGDVLEYVNKKLKKNNYITFDVIAGYDKLQINNGYNNSNYIHMIAIKKNNLEKICNGFDLDFAFGNSCEIDEMIFRISNVLSLDLVRTDNKFNIFGIYQNYINNIDNLKLYNICNIDILNKKYEYYTNNNTWFYSYGIVKNISSVNIIRFVDNTNFKEYVTNTTLYADITFMDCPLNKRRTKSVQRNSIPFHIINYDKTTHHTYIISFIISTKNKKTVGKELIIFNGLSWISTNIKILNIAQTISLDIIIYSSDNLPKFSIQSVENGDNLIIKNFTISQKNKL